MYHCDSAQSGLGTLSGALLPVVTSSASEAGQVMDSSRAGRGRVARSPRSPGGNVASSTFEIELGDFSATQRTKRSSAGPSAMRAGCA